MNTSRHSVVCFRTNDFFKLKLLEQANTIVTYGLTMEDNTLPYILNRNLRYDMAVQCSAWGFYNFSSFYLTSSHIT